MVRWMAGVDGCHAGWVVVLLGRKSGGISRYEVRVCSRFEEVLTLEPRPSVIAVDIPIGLLDGPRAGARVCDREARRLLGRRASSVFTPPTRSLLGATNYRQVRSSGMSIQAFGILGKIREVDRVTTPEFRDLVCEAHPELAFMALAGHPMRHNKKTPRGREERLRALERSARARAQGIRRAVENALNGVTRQQVAPDDVLDAFVLTQTALKIADGQATRLPPDPPRDQKGLWMEIWY
ncbi:MAG: DUF429 domain-containing protein [Candidatus Methylomirabilia bacterium]